jgi:CRISPR system Cascade subunit CasE
MYLTELRLNLRNRATVSWVDNPYRIHQRLWMALPQDVKKSHEGKGNTNIKDRAAPPFLFRVQADFMRNGKPCPRILVQSAFEADWTTTFMDVPFLIENGVETKRFDDSFIREGRYFSFDCLLNPTKKIKNYRLLFKEELKDYPEIYSPSVHKKYMEGKQKLTALVKNVTREERERLPSVKTGIYDEEEQMEWLNRKGGDHGFQPVKVTTKNVNDGNSFYNSVYVYQGRIQASHKSSGETGIEHRVQQFIVNYKGILCITDEAKFKKAYTSGIGSAKAFGCGLLLIKRI